MPTIVKHNFYDSVKVGEACEYAFLTQWLELKYPAPEWTIRDVTGDPYFRNKDIDFIVGKTAAIQGLSNKEIFERELYSETYEVKADYFNETGNIFCETCSNVEWKTPGCHLKTEAGIIVHIAPNGEMLLFDVEKLKAFIIEFVDGPSEAKNFTEVENEDPIRGNKITVGYTIRVRDPIIMSTQIHNDIEYDKPIILIEQPWVREDKIDGYSKDGTK